MIGNEYKHVYKHQTVMHCVGGCSESAQCKNSIEMVYFSYICNFSDIDNNKKKSVNQGIERVLTRDIENIEKYALS